MKKTQLFIIQGISYFFILLFIYASISKIMDFENFQVQIGQSPLLSAYAGIVSYAVIITELIIVVLLSLPYTRKIRLYSSTALMSAFTVYIYLILNYSEFVPCSCGGILEKLGWTEHLIFNMICVVIGITGVIFLTKISSQKIKEPIIVLVVSNSVSVLIVIVLFVSSEHIIKNDNNFTRRFLMYPVLEDKSREIDCEQCYFAGEDSENIYLGSRKFPQILTTVSKNFERTTTLKVTPENLSLPFKNISITVRPPYYFLSDGTVPVIFRGKIGNSSAKMISYQDAYFSQIIVKDSVNFILRSFSGSTKVLTIASLSLNTIPKVKLHNGIIQKQKDGVFDSDGQLTISNHPFRLLYMYNYRNQFAIADQNFAVLNNLNTIDTTRTAKIETRKLSDGRHKMVAPPLKVNQMISSQANLAFIQSALIGRNESSTTWKKAKVIDIYRIDESEYIGSFYIYNQGNNKMSDYLAGSSHFFALIGQKLVRFSYRKPITKYLNTGEAENLNKE